MRLLAKGRGKGLGVDNAQVLDRPCQHNIEKAEVAIGFGDDLARLDDDDGVELEPFGRRGRQAA